MSEVSFGNDTDETTDDITVTYAYNEVCYEGYETAYALNHITYRSYYHDEETDFYYLQSRY